MIMPENEAERAGRQPQKKEDNIERHRSRHGGFRLTQWVLRSKLGSAQKLNHFRRRSLSGGW